MGVREYGGVAFGWALEDTDHFAKVIIDPETRQLLGAHILGPEMCIRDRPGPRWIVLYRSTHANNS